MVEASRKSLQKTCEGSPACISSAESQAGTTPSPNLAGTTQAALFGPDRVLAPPSAPAEKAKGLQTLATSGRIGIDSLASSALQQSLENRLMERLDTAGSTLFNLTWKRKSTPLGRRYLERAALAHRTGDRGYSSLPTPTAAPDSEASHNQSSGSGTSGSDGGSLSGSNTGRPSRSSEYLDQPRQGLWRESTEADGSGFGALAELSAVPTPMAGTPAQNGYNEAGNTDYSRKIVELATLATPRSEDSECAGAHRGIADGLHSQAKLSTVPTPRTPTGGGESGRGRKN